jgi:acetyl esterase/lipase
MTRHLILAGIALVFAAQPGSVAAQVRVVANQDYISASEYANNKDRLDLYVPPGAKSAPVVVWIHGGALRQGDKAEDTHVGQRLASAGYVTAVINYRLSPGVSHPAHIEDTAAAVAWVHRNAGSHGGDPAKLVVAGHSAGAYLAALLATDGRYLAAHRMSTNDVKAVVPVSAFFYVDREGVAPDRPKDVWGADLNDWKAASPAQYLRGHVPPMLLLYADGDEPWRRQQQQDFAAALRAAGHERVESQMIAERTHMSILGKMGESGDPTTEALVRFVDRTLSVSSR